MGLTETGTTPPKSNPNFFGDYIPFLSPANIQQNRIVNENQWLSKEGMLYGRVVPCNSILQVCIGGSIGKCAIVNKSVTFNQQINSITPILCETKFLYWSLLSNTFLLAMIEKSTGTATPIINKGNWERLLLPLPPLVEQQRIVEKIEELIPHIEHYSKAQAELDLLNKNIKEQLKKSVLQYAIEGKLVPQDKAEGTAEELLLQIQKEKLKLYEENKLKKKDLEHSIIFKGEDNKYYEKIGKNVICIDEEIPFEIPNGWVWARMGQIGDWGAGSTPSRSNPNYYNGKILWLKTGELNNGIVFDTEEKITEKAFQECSLRINKVGNVLIAMYGATIGKLAIAGKELTTNQACCGCFPYLINNWYLFYFLMASREQFIKRGEGGAQPNISRVKLVEHLIPLPPLSEQQRIVNTIQNIFRCIEKN